jgi:hypothetical protein
MVAIQFGIWVLLQADAASYVRVFQFLIFFCPRWPPQLAYVFRNLGLFCPLDPGNLVGFVVKLMMGFIMNLMVVSVEFEEDNADAAQDANENDWSKGYECCYHRSTAVLLAIIYAGPESGRARSAARLETRAALLNAGGPTVYFLLLFQAVVEMEILPFGFGVVESAIHPGDPLA